MFSVNGRCGFWCASSGGKEGSIGISYSNEGAFRLCILRVWVRLEHLAKEKFALAVGRVFRVLS